MNEFIIEYKDFDKDIFLTVYADTIAYDNDGDKNILIAIRFGGYSEQVRAMADVIYGGGKISINSNEKTVYVSGLIKQYRKFITSEGIYTEATLIAENNNIKFEEGNMAETVLQTKHIFCENSSYDGLFDSMDKILSMPLISDFHDYIISELMKKDILKKVNTLSVKNEFSVWKLSISPNESNIIKVVEEGLKKGEISIPNATKDNEIFEEINSVSSYLNTFGTVIAERIKNQFNPLFEPSKDELSKEVLNVNQNIKEHVGYELYNAQQAVAEAMKRHLDKSKFALCVAECGTGKTKNIFN